MSRKIFQVDAFTDRPFAGNPAAVCLLPEPRDETWMQDVAAEMNLAETAFLVARDDGWDLRWFTPKTEVELCGHATLASAHVLWEEALLDPRDEARFHTLHSGVLTARRRGEWIELDFPSHPPSECDPPPDLVQGLGVTPVWTGRNGGNHLVEVESETVLRGLAPDFARLGRLETGVIATARSDDPRFDFASRYFAPIYGIDEDSVTGSAHCTLGPYWQRHLGKAEFLARQVSHRGGVVKVRVAGPRTLLGGRAVTVLRGELTDPAPAVV